MRAIVVLALLLAACSSGPCDEACVAHRDRQMMIMMAIPTPPPFPTPQPVYVVNRRY